MRLVKYALVILGVVGLWALTSIQIGPTVATVATAVILVGIVIAEGRRAELRRRRRLMRRGKVRVDAYELIACRLHVSRDVVDAVVAIIAESIRVPKEYIHPTDAFAGVLALEPGWDRDDGIWLIPLELHDVFGGGVDQYALTQNPTVEHMISTAAMHSRAGLQGHTAPSSRLK